MPKYLLSLCTIDLLGMSSFIFFADADIGDVYVPDSLVEETSFIFFFIFFRVPGGYQPSRPAL